MTKQPKEQRFQLFLHELHEPTCESAKANGRTLSSEVRHRVKQSFEQDDILAELRAFLGCAMAVDPTKQEADDYFHVLNEIKNILDDR